MKRKAVSSSAVVSVGYDLKSKTLEIEFPSGHVYQYFDVPAAEHKALVNADSLGQFFNAEIKDCYSCIQVRQAPQPLASKRGAAVHRSGWRDEWRCGSARREDIPTR